MPPLPDNSTPPHDASPSTNSKCIIDHFITTFEPIRVQSLNDQFHQSGKLLLEQKLKHFIEQQLPIEIVLPAFPCKSPNSKNKVLGKLPDRGEELALIRLEAFCIDIEKVYSPGAFIVIFSDGRVFNDLLGVSTTEVQQYKQALRKMAKQLQCNHIRFDALDNYTSSESPIAEILQRYQLTNFDIVSAIKQDSNLRNTYCGFQLFLLTDLEERFRAVSRTQKKKLCAQVAKQMMHRNMAFSLLVDDCYPNAIRFSIHAHNNAGSKLGIHLLPAIAKHQPRTPWHGVIVEEENSTQIIPLHDIDTSKYELQWKNGQKWYFKYKFQEA